MGNKKNNGIEELKDYIKWLSQEQKKLKEKKQALIVASQVMKDDRIKQKILEEIDNTAILIQTNRRYIAEQFRELDKLRNRADHVIRKTKNLWWYNNRFYSSDKGYIVFWNEHKQECDYQQIVSRTKEQINKIPVNEVLVCKDEKEAKMYVNQLNKQLELLPVVEQLKQVEIYRKLADATYQQEYNELKEQIEQVEKEYKNKKTTYTMYHNIYSNRLKKDAIDILRDIKEQSCN